jgi:hypothetical protein
VIYEFQKEYNLYTEFADLFHKRLQASCCAISIHIFIESTLFIKFLFIFVLFTIILGFVIIVITFNFMSYSLVIALNFLGMN